MTEISPGQKRVLEYIRRHQRVFHMPPTRHEIAVELGFASDNAAHQHLKALACKGYISLTPGISRGIRVLEAA